MRIKIRVDVRKASPNYVAPGTAKIMLFLFSYADCPTYCITVVFTLIIGSMI